MDILIISFVILAVGLVAILVLVNLAARKRSISDSNTLGSNPTQDNDRDRITNTEETQRYGTDPDKYDTDLDGIGDRDEILQGSNPNSADSDRDGLTDLEERQTQTDPTHWDTDRDGVSDDRDID